MGTAIKLKEEYTLNNTLFFVTTNSLINLLEKQGFRFEDVLSRFSQSRVLLITSHINKKDNQLVIDVHTPFGVFSCVPNSVENSNWECLLITYFSPNAFASQNNAIKNGISFAIQNGICVSVKNQQKNVYCEYVNGSIRATTVWSSYNSNAVMVIKNALEAKAQAAGGSRRKPQQEHEEYKPTEQLESFLTTAQNYAELFNELEENKVISSGKLSYTDIRPLDYDRTDRIAYRFIVTALNKDVFAVKTQVEVEDRRGNANNAEIINSEMDENGERHVDLLFNKQISIDSFEKTGFISLSFSSVIKDVQMQAIENIRKGVAPAKYMDDILGRFSPAGFDNTDLQYLIDRYNDKTIYTCPPFPPNPSQQEAIVNGIKSKDVFLVMGPPGTGKTTVILEWIKYFVLEKHLRVLVSSQNNKAVDNVLERIIEEKDVDVLRIGSEAKLQENVKQCMFENKVAALREAISDGSRENKSRLLEIEENNRKALGYMEEVGALAVRTKQFKDELDAAAQSILLPAYKACESTRKRAENVSKSAQSNVEKLDKLDARYDKLLQSHSKLFGWLINIIMMFVGRKITKISVRLESQRNELASLGEQYGREYEAYKARYHEIEQAQYARYADALGRQLECTENALRLINTQDEFAINSFNLTADDLLSSEQIAAVAQQLQINSHRIAQTIKILEDWASEMDSNQNYVLNEIILQSVNLVGATCIGINSQKRFADLQFDVTIIDEAGQIQIHNALVPMSVSNKLIMLGDHKQIPPTAEPDTIKIMQEREMDTELYEKSLFEIMYNELPDSNKRMLDTQFRMPGEIADIISEWFYDGKYLSAPFKRGVKSLMPAVSEKPLVVVDTSMNPNRFESEKKNGTNVERSNELECDIIVKLCKHLKDMDFDFSELGIISALKAQVVRIKQKLVEAGFDPKLVNETVATLDSFQGQERKIILYSFTRSARKSATASRVGFLTELRRLNVAMSRCKQTIVLIGDMTYLSECERVVGHQGEAISKEKTEKNFSEFIIKMLNDIRYKNRGEIITDAELDRRLTEN